MRRSLDDILRLYKERKALYEPLHAKMRAVADVYNGRAQVPLPDMDRDEGVSIPNLLQQGVDQMAGRITSVRPMVTFSSQKPGVRTYDRRAKAATDVIGGWWQMDRTMLKHKQRGRRLIAYAMAPTVIRWDYKEHRPIWHLRHPLEALPSPDIQPGQISPEDCLFSYQRTVGWMHANGYGEHLHLLTGRNVEVTRDTRINIVEYMDADQTVLLATGMYRNDGYNFDPSYSYYDSVLKGVQLEWYPNLIDEMPVTIPTRLTLDKMTGQFDNMLGMYYQQAKLMALEVIAVEKGIFPDTYLVSRPGEMGRFIDGPHDGRTGMINVIQGGDIQTEQPQPGYITNPTMDRLERAQRLTAGIPAEFGGESGSNIRTGRRGDAVLSATIDFPIAEAQQIFEFSFEEENEYAMKLAKRIDGSTPRTIYVGAGNSRRPVTYKATEVFEVEEHIVSHPASGTDVNSLILGIGQRVGLGIMSKETAASLDPYIDNPEVEHDLIISEGLEQALMAGIQQQAQSGAIPPLVLAKIMKLVSLDKMELAEAMNKVTEDAMAEEKKKQEAAQGGAMPGEDPMSAEAAMSGPAAQAMTGAPPSPVPGVGGGMKDLATMLGDLRRPNMTIQPQRGVAQGAM
jgi:hypothetical protein